MTRNVPLNQHELSLVLSVFEGQPLSHEDDGKSKMALYRKFKMAFEGVVSIEGIVKGLPEDFRHEVYNTYHGTPKAGRWRKGKIAAVKMVYERLGKKSLIEAKQVAEAIGGEISS